MTVVIPNQIDELVAKLRKPIFILTMAQGKMRTARAEKYVAASTVAWKARREIDALVLDYVGDSDE